MPELFNDRYWKMITESLPLGLFLADSEGRIIKVNSFAQKIWAGYCLVPMNLYDKYKGWQSTGELIKPDEWAIAKAAKYGETTIGEVIEIERFDGTKGTILNSAAPLKDEEGNIIGAIAVNHDITYQKELEREVNELFLQKELARLERLKIVGQMAGSISHEVRNPLTVVKGFLQLMSVKEKYEDDKEFFDMMIGELDRATDILSEYLYLAQIRPVNIIEHDLNKIIKSISPLIVAEAMKYEVNFRTILNEIPPLMVDEKEIRQLILNLTRNAIEATPPRKCIDIETCVIDQSVVLTVRDEGCGIPSEVLNNIGTPFVTTKDKGTGLGLSVCYNIIRRHNAKIDVETSEKGTTFNIRFPFKIATN